MENFFENINFEQELFGAGKVLISEPFLPDPNFNRSVILLVEHNKEGTIGFVLNRPSDLMITDVIDEFPNSKIPVFLGGPVGLDQLFYMHTAGNLITGSKEILPGLFWGGNFEQIKLLIESGEITSNGIRFFVGYSGWSEHQLAEEVKERSWIVSKLKTHEIMSDSSSFWEDALKGMGKEFKVFAQFPEDPSLN